MINIHVTNHSEGTKMDGIQSISSSCLVNPICKARRECPDTICAHCYAHNLCKMRKSLDEHLRQNFYKLNRRLLTPQEAKAVKIDTYLGRIESFGDVASVTQARNYIRIIKAHPKTRFGVWSKNWGIWLVAFKQEGKPKNCTFVLSSMEVNKVDEVNPRMVPYADHVFTVWDKELYDGVIAEHPETECAGLSCERCRKCYHKPTAHGSSFYINERRR